MQILAVPPSLRGTETFVLGLHRSKENLDVAKKENSVILMEDNYRQTYEGFDPNSSESYIMFELVQDTYLDKSLSFADDIQRQFKSRLESSNRGVKTSRISGSASIINAKCFGRNRFCK